MDDLIPTDDELVEVYNTDPDAAAMQDEGQLVEPGGLRAVWNDGYESSRLELDRLQDQIMELENQISDLEDDVKVLEQELELQEDEDE